MEILDMVGTQPIGKDDKLDFDGFFIFRGISEEEKSPLSKLSDEEIKEYTNKGNNKYSVEYFYVGCGMSHVFGRGMVYPSVTITADNLVESEKKAINLIVKLYGDKKGLVIRSITGLYDHKLVPIDEETDDKQLGNIMLPIYTKYRR